MRKISIFIPLILGTIVGFVLMNSFDFYKTLFKPFFAPPNWIFPIVWTVLYLLMGISYYIVRRKDEIRLVTVVYYLQLLSNLFWPILFFGFEQLLLSSILIVCLDALIIAMIYLFNKVDKTASYLQIPYLMWTVFATILNISIYILNL